MKSLKEEDDREEREVVTDKETNLSLIYFFFLHPYSQKLLSKIRYLPLDKVTPILEKIT